MPTRIGDWSIEAFTVSEKDAQFGRLHMAIGHPRDYVPAGEYLALKHHGHLVMTNTPAELRDIVWPIERAKGHCLVTGLGLGCVVTGMLEKPGVVKVTVVEIAPEVVELVGKALAQKYGDRLEIVLGDALKYRPPRGVRYGAVWHDIWNNICADNLPEMRLLRRRFIRRCDWQGCWCENESRA